MKITANIKYPPPKFEVRNLEFDEACKLVDALTAELVVTNRQLGACEAVLERCKACFDQHVVADDDAISLVRQLRREIEEVLK